MSIPALGKLIWCKQWEGFGEGPYTIIAKLMYANAIGASRIRKIFKWQLECDLIKILPATKLSEENSYLAQMVRGKCLASMTPRFHDHISSGQQFRYCYICMHSGFQGAIFQITGLIYCPIHNIRLVSSCRKCNAPTGSYSLRISEPLPRFRCSACNHPYSGLPNDHDYLDISTWVAPDNSRGALTASDDWFSIINDKIDWINIEWWSTCNPSSRSKSSREAVVFYLLNVVTSGMEWKILHAKTFVSDLYKIYESQTEYSLTIDEYSEILGSLFAPSNVIDYQTSFARVQYFKPPRYVTLFPIRPDVSPFAHAILIWRSQFERRLFFDWKRSSDLHLDPDAVQSFLSKCFGEKKTQLASSKIVLGLLKAAWAAALLIAEEWQMILRGLPEGIEADEAKELLQPTIGEWIHLLGRWAEYKSMPIGVVVERINDVDSATAIRFVIGSPEGATNSRF